MKDNAELIELELSGIEFSFDRERPSYSLSVESGVLSSTVTAAATNTQATVAISRDDDSSTDGHLIDLSPGANVSTVSINSADGTTTQTYEITVTRATE